MPDPILQSIANAQKAHIDSQVARAQVVATALEQRVKAAEKAREKAQSNALTARSAAEKGRRDAARQEKEAATGLASVLPQPQVIRGDEQGIQASLGAGSAGSIGGLGDIVQATTGGAAVQRAAAGGAGGANPLDPFGVNATNPLEGGRLGTDIRSEGGRFLETTRAPLQTGIRAVDLVNTLTGAVRGGRPPLVTESTRERPDLAVQAANLRFREREFEATQQQRELSNRLQREQFQALQDQRSFDRKVRQEELQLRRSSAKMELFSDISRNAPEMNTLDAAELADTALRQGPLAMAQQAEAKGIPLNQLQQVEFRAKQIAVDSAERTLANARARDERITSANTPLRTIFPTTAPNPNVPEFTDEARSLRSARIDGELAKLAEGSDAGQIPRSSSVRLASVQQELVHDNRAVLPSGVDGDVLRGIDATSTTLDRWVATIALANAEGFGLLGQFPPDQQEDLLKFRQAAFSRLRRVGFLDDDNQVRNDPADSGSGAWAQVFRDQFDAAARAARTGYAKDIIVKQLFEPFSAAEARGDEAAAVNIVIDFFGAQENRGEAASPQLEPPR